MENIYAEEQDPLFYMTFEEILEYFGVSKEELKD